MARFDDLPADQQAVLQLVLRQGRTYEEIAGLLRIESQAVRERALAALDAMAGDEDPGLAPGDREAVGDYLLSQQGASARVATRGLLEQSQPARAWARRVAAELRGAGAGLPEIPADPVEVEEAFDALDARQQARREQERSSRLGILLVLAGIGLAIAAAIVIAVSVGDDDDGGDTVAATTTAPAVTATAPTTATPAPTTTATTPTTTAPAPVEAEVDLAPPSGAAGDATAVATIGARTLSVVGESLPPGNRYVLWLRDGDRVRFLGFFGAVKEDGRLGGRVAAPGDLASYRELLVTRERERHPTRPTTVVLQGPLSG